MGLGSLGLILLAALLAVTPEYLWGVAASDSYRYNLLWTDEFVRQFASGDPYPRWLFQSWDGLGAPTFFHYPPLFFWTASLVSGLAGGRLPLGALISSASAIMFFASGVTSYFWFKRFCRRGVATAAAIAYLLAPYHLYDVFARGALAEASAYAVLPAILVAISRVRDRALAGVPLLALSYGLLILAHLPSAVVASISLVPAWILFNARTAGWPFVARCVIALVAGVGSVSFYLVPALSLLPHTLNNALTTSFYDPGNWAFWKLAEWPNTARAIVIVLLASVPLVVAAACLWARDRNSEQGLTWWWAGLTILLFAMIGGFIPYFWRLPGLSLVQFPTRLIPEAELAALTVLTIARPRLMHPATLAAVLVASIAWMISGDIIVQRTRGTVSQASTSAAAVFADRRDDPAYLPAGHAIPIARSGLRIANPSLVELPERNWLVSAQGASIRATSTGDAIDLETDAPRTTIAVARRFFHPRWIVDTDGGALVEPFAEPGSQLVAWPISAGHHHYRLRSRRLPVEHASRWISLLTLSLLLAAYGIARWRPARSATRRRAVGD